MGYSETEFSSVSSVCFVLSMTSPVALKKEKIVSSVLMSPVFVNFSFSLTVVCVRFRSSWRRDECCSLGEEKVNYLVLIENII